MERENKQETMGFKGILYLIVFLLITAGVVVLQLRFKGFAGPLPDTLVIIALVLANFLLLTAVIFMTARSLWKLSTERKRGVLGAKFRTKLVAAFVSISFIPTILLFIIGSGMFTKSIERLFSLKIENALLDAVFVAETHYDGLQNEALRFGRQISGMMTEERFLNRFDKPVLEDYLGKKAEEYGLGSVEFYSAPGERVLSIITGQFPADAFVATPAELIARAFNAEEVTGVSGSGKAGEIVRAVVPLYALEEGGTVVAALAVSYHVPKSLAAKADQIRTAAGEYRSSFKGKELIKLAYRLAFLTITLMLLLAAIWVALRVSSGITVPIRKLAEGTVAVASGDLDYQVEEKSADEVGILVDSFNRMTRDLRNSRERLEQEIIYKETILSNIDTGVVSFDRLGRIITINAAAERILGIRSDGVINRRYDDAFSFIELAPIRSLFRKLEQGKGRAEEVISLPVRGRTLTLRMRITTLRDSSGTMSVITFNDLTELLRAQKSETWQDVARKIAHEVKNPLTPIKLSAERLRKKFSEGSPDFDAVFEECSMTIVQQADGLKKLLNEFSEYARMPRSNPLAGPLAPVIDSMIQMYAGTYRNIEFVKDVPADLPDVLLDQEQMQRVFLNLFVNAIEAMDGNGKIWVTVRLASEGMVRIEVLDEGPGISEEDMPRVFEPYFSSKKRGGGLGLAIVERVIADHNGSIHVEQRKPRGARIVIELPTVSWTGSDGGDGSQEALDRSQEPGGRSQETAPS
ncbi:MAG TPA: hypothetical protein DCO77_05975 [Nitrospiraceae bacterium]|nr:hypothetical protein [Nitrospiraceae bacterium]